MPLISSYYHENANSKIERPRTATLPKEVKKRLCSARNSDKKQEFQNRFSNRVKSAPISSQKSKNLKNNNNNHYQLDRAKSATEFKVRFNSNNSNMNLTDKTKIKYPSEMMNSFIQFQCPFYINSILSNKEVSINSGQGRE